MRIIQSLGGGGGFSDRPFPIMLLKLAFYALRNSALRRKECSNYALKVVLLWSQKMLCLISSKT